MKAKRGGVAPPSGQITPVGSTHPASHLPGVVYFQRPLFNNVQFDAQHVLEFAEWDDDMEAESTVAIVPMLREDLITGLSRGLEAAILDGHSVVFSSHQDRNIRADTTNGNVQIETIWNGLRFLANHNDGASTPALNGAGISATAGFGKSEMIAAAKKMGAFMQTAGQVTLCLPLKVYWNLMLEDVVITVDKFGPSATVRTGTMGAYFGVEIITPEFFSRYDLSGLGVRPSPAGTKAWALVYREDRFWLGQFGSARIERTRNAPLLHNVLQVDTRFDFKAVDTDLLDTSSPGLNQFDTGKAGYPLCGIFNIDPDGTPA